MHRVSMSLICLSACLGGCDTENGIRSNRDYPSPIDTKCVEEALRKEFGQVQRFDYVHGGAGGTFAKGTSVAEFAYYRPPDKEAFAILSIGHGESGARVSHSFSRIGPKPPQAEFPPALAAMRRARDAVRISCGLNLSDMKMREIRQSWP